MAHLFSFLKIPAQLHFPRFYVSVFFSNGDGSFPGKSPLMAKHLLDSTNITILSAVSLDVESYSAFINFFHKCNFYTNISILAAVSHDDERTAPSSIFSDEIDYVKFITISKATKEKRSLAVAIMAGFI